MKSILFGLGVGGAWATVVGSGVENPARALIFIFAVLLAFFAYRYGVGKGRGSVWASATATATATASADSSANANQAVVVNTYLNVEKFTPPVSTVESLEASSIRMLTQDHAEDQDLDLFTESFAENPDKHLEDL